MSGGARAMLVGYMRISTAEQSLALQRDALLAAGVAPERIYQDTCSGTVADRPGLARALDAARAGLAPPVAAVGASVFRDGYVPRSGDGYEAPGVPVGEQVEAQYAMGVMAVGFARPPPGIGVPAKPGPAGADHERPQALRIRPAHGVQAAELLEMMVVPGEHDGGASVVERAVGAQHHPGLAADRPRVVGAADRLVEVVAVAVAVQAGE